MVSFSTIPLASTFNTRVALKKKISLLEYAAKEQQGPRDPENLASALCIIKEAGAAGENRTLGLTLTKGTLYH